MNIPKLLAKVRGNSTETDDIRYNRLLCKWFELNSNRTGSNNMSQSKLSDEERKIWIDEIRYLDLALSIAAKDITLNEIDAVIPIILKVSGKYHDGFVRHDIRKVFSICKKYEDKIYDAIGRCIRFQHASHVRRINGILRKEYGYGIDRNNLTEDDSSSYTVTDYSFNSCLNQSYSYDSNRYHKYDINEYHKYHESNSDRMLDDYMNNNTVQQCLDNCFKPETEYIKPEVEVIALNDIVSNKVETITFNEPVETNIKPLEPTNMELESIESVLEEGEIDLNKEDIVIEPVEPITLVNQVNTITPTVSQVSFNETGSKELSSVNPINTTVSNNVGLVVKPIKVSTVVSNKVVSDSVKPINQTVSPIVKQVDSVKPIELDNYKPINPTNPTQVSPMSQVQVSPLISSEANLIINSLIQNVVPRALQNVNNTIKDEIDKLNKTRDEVNAYLDEVIAKLKSMQSLM